MASDVHQLKIIEGIVGNKIGSLIYEHSYNIITTNRFY